MDSRSNWYSHRPTPSRYRRNDNRFDPRPLFNSGFGSRYASRTSYDTRPNHYSHHQRYQNYSYHQRYQNNSHHQRYQNNRPQSDKHPAIKILFQILQCIHHASVISRQIDGSPTRGFFHKIRDLNNFVKPAMKNFSVTSAIEANNKLWAKNIASVLKSHYDSQLKDKLDSIKQLKLSDRHIEDYANSAVQLAKSSYRRLQKDTTERFREIVSSLKSNNVESMIEDPVFQSPLPPRPAAFVTTKPTPKRKRSPPVNTLSPTIPTPSKRANTLSSDPVTPLTNLCRPLSPSPYQTPSSSRSNPETPKPQRTTTRRRLSLDSSPALSKPRLHKQLFLIKDLLQLINEIKI